MSKTPWNFSSISPCRCEDPGAKILIFIGRWVKQKGVDHIAMLTQETTLVPRGGGGGSEGWGVKENTQDVERCGVDAKVFICVFGGSSIRIFNIVMGHVLNGNHLEPLRNTVYLMKEEQIYVFIYRCCYT